jgi:hypothetical protein
MDVKDENYRVWLDEPTAVVRFEGSLRLNTAEYEPIWGLLNACMDGHAGAVTLDLKDLVFLNSSGINVIYKFAIALRKKGGVQLKVLGGKDVAWQAKSLPNLSKFLPGTEISMG